MHNACATITSYTARNETDMKKQKVTILYSRFSVNDTDKESMSITNQRFYLEEYAEKNNFKPFIHIQDDGFSGSNWERPGWQEVVKKLENNEVSIIISKDGSRLGRDYLRVGLYREMFREKGVRLITIADGFDSEKGEDDFTPFRDILAEWYARDTSRKIRTIFDAKTNDGKHVSGSIPYGYLHDQIDRQKWIVDEEAAKVIKHIFQLVIEGNGVYQIANILEKEKILIPSAHWKTVGEKGNARKNFPNPYLWRGGVVSKILEREEYLGNKVLRKTFSQNYKNKKRKETAKEDRLVFEGAIPQIIDEETWHNAQRLRRTVRRPSKNGAPPYRLTGLLYCSDCGAKMTHDRSVYSKPRKKPKNEYLCSNYRQRTRSCTIHFIRVPVVEELILTTIKSVSKYVLTNEAEFSERVKEVSAIHQETSIKENKKLFTKSKHRHDEIDMLIKKLYESFATGKIPEKHFQKLIDEYDKEQTLLTEKIKLLQAEIETFNSNSVKADKFIEIVKRYTDFKELTTPMLNEFIEKIIVHNADISTGKRIQQVDIYLNFIGQFDTPIVKEEPTEEELEAKRKYEAIRARDREKLRRWRQKQKEKKEIEKAV